MDELMKIRDISTRYDISARTLRYYEDMGLLNSVRSDDYAYRMYDEAAITRLEQILILRKLNISIKDIQRIFSTSGSEVVLEVLGSKINDIDTEVALLHELKEIILDFIRQIEAADFAKDSDIKMLYSKAKEIETHLTNADYSGKPANIARLLEVTEKLETQPEIVERHTYVYNIFNLGSVQNVIDAVDAYQRAFDADITSTDTTTGGDGWIGINIRVFNFGIFVQSNDDVQIGGACCINFATEDELRKAYAVLSQGAKSSVLNTDWGWTPLSALVTDRFNVTWLLCI